MIFAWNSTLQNFEFLIFCRVILWLAKVLSLQSSLKQIFTTLVTSVDFELSGLVCANQLAFDSSKAWNQWMTFSLYYQPSGSSLSVWCKGNRHENRQYACWWSESKFHPQPSWSIRVRVHQRLSKIEIWIRYDCLLYWQPKKSFVILLHRSIRLSLGSIVGTDVFLDHFLQSWQISQRWWKFILNWAEVTGLLQVTVYYWNLLLQNVHTFNMVLHTKSVEATNLKSSDLNNRQIYQNSEEWNFKGKSSGSYWCLNYMIQSYIEKFMRSQKLAFKL